jgi:serine/threonine-protein kinase RsbW
MPRRILIIDDHDDLATALDEVFSHVGHSVTLLESRSDALALTDLDDFDLVITDLDITGREVSRPTGNGAQCLPRELASAKPGEYVKAFKLCASNFGGSDFDERELQEIVATVLDYKIRFVDRTDQVRELRENIEFELPSVISLMHVVLEYLMKRVEKLGVVKAEQSNLYVALDEAFVNAVKHGNRFDQRKLVRVIADVSAEEARFTIEDEGEGFDVNSIPDPLDPQNLFKPSGRGVLFIYNIMDEVSYNDRGNRLTMVKKSEQQPVG